MSHSTGPNFLVAYSIFTALAASVTLWVVHFVSYLWHTFFEAYVFQERATQVKVQLQAIFPTEFVSTYSMLSA